MHAQCVLWSIILHSVETIVVDAPMELCLTEFISEISCFSLLVITCVRKVQFQKEKLHSVTRIEFFQKVCFTNELF